MGFFFRNPRDYLRCLVIYYAILDLRGNPDFEAVLSPDAIRSYSPAACLDFRAGI